MNKICSIVSLALGAIGVFSGILTVVFYPDLYHYIMKLVSTEHWCFIERNCSFNFLATRCYLGLLQFWPVGGDPNSNAYEHLLFQCDQRWGGHAGPGHKQNGPDKAQVGETKVCLDPMLSCSDWCKLAPTPLKNITRRQISPSLLMGTWWILTRWSTGSLTRRTLVEICRMRSGLSTWSPSRPQSRPGEKYF